MNALTKEEKLKKLIKETKLKLEKLQAQRKLELGKLAYKHKLNEFDNKQLDTAFAALYKKLVHDTAASN